VRLDIEFKDDEVMFNDNVKYEESGFMENAFMANGQMIDHMTSMSQWFNTGEFFERNRLLKDYMDKEILDGSSFAKSRGVSPDYDWSALARHAKDSGLEGLKTDREIYDDMRSTIKDRDDMAQEVMSRSSLAGDFGGFAGYATGGVVDPWLVGTAIAGPLALSRFIGSSIGGIALKEGLSAVAGESITQFGFVQDWEESIGIIHTNQDALINIAGAGFATAGLTYFIGGLGALIRKAGGGLNKQELITAVQSLQEAEELHKINPKGDWMDMQMDM